MNNQHYREQGRLVPAVSAQIQEHVLAVRTQCLLHALAARNATLEHALAANSAGPGLVLVANNAAPELVRAANNVIIPQAAAHAASKVGLEPVHVVKNAPHLQIPSSRVEAHPRLQHVLAR